MLALLRRGLGRAISSQPKNTRSMADMYVPKPDTSMDHVFGDNSVRLPYNVGVHVLVLDATQVFAGHLCILLPVLVTGARVVCAAIG